jgi:hypothetical protein
MSHAPRVPIPADLAAALDEVPHVIAVMLGECDVFVCRPLDLFHVIVGIACAPSRRVRYSRSLAL